MYVGGVRAQTLRLLHAVLFLLLAVTGSCAVAACVDPATLVHSTVSVTKHFSEEERKGDSTLLGIRGTAWFLSPRLLVTAAHVAESMGLSDQEWKQVEINGEETKRSGFVRIRQLKGLGTEKIAVIELRNPIPDAKPLRIRMESLTAGEHVASLAYPSNRLRFASGEFVNYSSDAKYAGSALLEMADGNDRLALDHGASGAPVLDCEGRVVAVVSNVFAKTMTFMSQEIRISTAWGTPNIASVPISVLEQVPGVK